MYGRSDSYGSPLNPHGFGQPGIDCPLPDEYGILKGVRTRWDPQPVAVRVLESTFFDSPPFRGVAPILANAFYLSDVGYAWKRGIRYPLNGAT